MTKQKLIMYAALTIMMLSPLMAKSDTYKIGVVPQFEARELADIWGTITSELNKSTLYDFEFVGSANIPEFERKFLAGEFDFIYSNPYHALTAYEHKKYVPIIRDGSRLLQGILVVRADSQLKSVTDLDGALITFPAPNALGASLMTRSDMTIKFDIDYEERYVKTHSSAYLNVFLGESDAAGGVLSTFKKLDEEISSQLKVIYTTTSVPPHPISFHPRVPKEVVDEFTDVILNFGNVQNGNSTLKRIPMFTPVETTIDEYLGLRNLSLDRFIK